MVGMAHDEDEDGWEDEEPAPPPAPAPSALGSALLNALAMPPNAPQTGLMSRFIARFIGNAASVPGLIPGLKLSPPPPYATPPANGATPVHDLPPELLADIIELAMRAQSEDVEDARDARAADPDDGSTASDPGTFLPFELVAAHVCRRWRDVALGAPNLWAYVDFSEGPPFERSKAYLERSREAPLEVSIDCTEEEDADAGLLAGGVEVAMDEDSDGDETEEVSEDEGEEVEAPPAPSPPSTMSSLSSHRSRPHTPARKRIDGRVDPADLPAIRDLVLPHAPRWRTFDLRSQSYEIVFGILHALSHLPAAPILEVLELHHYEDTPDTDEAFPYPEYLTVGAPFQGSAPRLHTLSLWGVHLDWSAAFLRANLRHLELAYHAPDVRPPYAVLASALPELESLALTSSGPSGSPNDWPSAPITAPGLQMLTLAQLPPQYVCALLSRWAFPNASVLTLDFDPDDYAPVLHALAATARAVERLKILGLHAGEAARAAFYGALGRLTELRLHAHHLPEHFVDALLPGHDDAPAGGVALPALTSLALMGVDGQLVRRIAEARRDAGHPLQRLLVERDTHLHAEDEDWLRAHVPEFELYRDEDDEYGSEDESEGSEMDGVEEFMMGLPDAEAEESGSEGTSEGSSVEGSVD